MSLDSPRVLIAYSRVGGGHRSAADALTEAFRDAGVTTSRMVDVYAECGRFPVSRIPRLYAWLARGHSSLWRMVFGATGVRLGPFDPATFLRPFLLPRLIRLLRSWKPDLVVSVLPGVNSLLPEALLRSEVAAPFSVVLTDWYRVHRQWVGGSVDRYLVPTAEVLRELEQYGVRGSRVDVLGIPVRRQFVQRGGFTRVPVLNSLGLDPDRFTVLVMVGAEGGPQSVAQVGGLLKDDQERQVIVVCGRAEELRKRVAALPARVPVRVLGFRTDVANLMAASDVLVTKAGGVTLAEAFVVGIPVIVGAALPGQEERNLAYAKARGAVLYAPEPGAVVNAVRSLQESPERRFPLITCARDLARPDASTDIVQSLLGDLHGRTVTR